MAKTLLSELKLCVKECGTNKTAFFDEAHCIIDQYEEICMGKMPPMSEDFEDALGCKESTQVKVDSIEMQTFGKLKEVDPNGVDAHDGGAKLDAGKNQLGSILGDFSNALMAVGEVGTRGAQKYSLGGWKEVPEGKRRYTDAMLRHFCKESNSLYDEELPVLHAAQVAWNALARLEFILKELQELEDAAE